VEPYTESRYKFKNKDKWAKLYVRSISRLKKFIENEYIMRSLRVNHKENVYSGSFPLAGACFTYF